MSTSPIPVIVTGASEGVGRSVIENLKPEYEVIHFIFFKSINEELPQVLQGKPPSPASNNLGSGNWSSPPQAILLGGAYTEEVVAGLRKLMDETEGALTIPWLRVDASKHEAPPKDPSPEVMAEYGRTVVVPRMKAELMKLSKEGKLGPGNGGVYFV